MFIRKCLASEVDVNVNVNETVRSEILKNLSREVVRKPEVRPLTDWNGPTRDVLQQFEANLSLLEDLHGRLQFVMSEVRVIVER